MSATPAASLSPDALRALVNLEYLIEEIGLPAVPATTLAVRSGLDPRSGEAVVDELRAGGLVEDGEHGLLRSSTPCPTDGPIVLDALAFADAVADDHALSLPSGWTPGVEVLAHPDLSHDVPERLAAILVAYVLHRDGREVTITALREVLPEVDARAVLDLVSRGLLPDQPELAGQLAEHRERLRVEDYEDHMPITIVGGR